MNLGDERIIILDIEATGLSTEFDRIIELGVVEYKGEKFIREYSKLFGGGKSKPSAVRVHGIRDEQRKGLPTFEDCSHKVADYLKGAILVGHNILRYDLPMIRAKMATVDIYLGEVKVIDTYKVCKNEDIADKKKIANLKLGTLCEGYNITYGNHRGLGDSKSTWNVLLRVCEEIGTKHINDIVDKVKE